MVRQRGSFVGTAQNAKYREAAGNGTVQDRACTRCHQSGKAPKISKADQRPSSYFKVGQFGYARVRQTSGGFATQDAGESKPGQAVYAVSKAKDGRGGAVWFTEDGIRFTGRGTAWSPHHETSGRSEPQPNRRTKTMGSLWREAVIFALPPGGTGLSRCRWPSSQKVP
jgi:hypothetical protein